MPDLRKARPIGLVLGSLLLPLLAACGSKQADSKLDLNSFREDQAMAAADREDFARTLAEIDRVLQEYTSRVNSNGRADSSAVALERYLVRRVVHIDDLLIQTAISDRVSVDDLPEDVPESVRRDLAQNDWQRPIAIAALGFSDNPDALDPILNGLDEPSTRSSAVFALSIRKDPRTPPRRLAAMIENDDVPSEIRANAAFALYEIQTAIIDQSPILAIWREMLEQPLGTYDPTILPSALRGLGLGHDPADADLIARYAVHPLPKIREATCIGLGELGDVSQYEVLLTLLDTSESNPNVRLAARVALKKLAGGEDRRYDVKQWRRVFEFNDN
jgi:HEAT repeat protein